MKVNTLTLGIGNYPTALAALPQPPKRLFYVGDLLHVLDKPALAVVGSRKATPYGRTVTTEIVGEIARHDIVIISGLAFGIDSIAHQAALDAGGVTIAVLPGGLDNIYPTAHRQLAKQIVDKGGALVSEYEPGHLPMKHDFIARNRIIAGLSNGVLITEAADKSGSLHTAQFALEQGLEVMAVPGNVTSTTSVGTNNLIKSGATPVTTSDDVFAALGFDRLRLNKTETTGATEEEQTILNLLADGVTESSALLALSGLDPAVFSRTLTMLEISGKIRANGTNMWHRR